MQDLPHLHYHADKRLRTPFPSLYDCVLDFLELATPATRCPIHVGISRYHLGPCPWDSSRTIRQPCEELMAWLHPERDGPENIAAMLAEALSRAVNPEVHATVRWSPNIVWNGRNSFSYLGLAESEFFLGWEHQHFVQLSTGNGQTSAFVYLAVPFDKIDSDFLSFLSEAERRLPFALGRPGWTMYVPRVKGKGMKPVKPQWPS